MKKFVSLLILSLIFIGHQSYAALVCQDYFNPLSHTAINKDLNSILSNAAQSVSTISKVKTALEANPQWSKVGDGSPMAKVIEDLRKMMPENTIEDIISIIEDPTQTFGSREVLQSLNPATLKQVNDIVVESLRALAEGVDAVSNMGPFSQKIIDNLTKPLANEIQKKLLEKIQKGEIDISLGDLGKVITRIQNILSTYAFGRAYQIQSLQTTLQIHAQTQDALAAELDIAPDVERQMAAKGGFGPGQASFGGRLANVLRFIQANRPAIDKSIADAVARTSAKIAEVPATKIDPEQTRLVIHKIREMHREIEEANRKADEARAEMAAEIDRTTAELRRMLLQNYPNAVENLARKKRLPPLDLSEFLINFPKKPGGEDVYPLNYVSYPFPKDRRDQVRRLIDKIDLASPAQIAGFGNSIFYYTSNTMEELLRGTGHKVYNGRKLPRVKMSALTAAIKFQQVVTSTFPGEDNINNYDLAALGQLERQTGDLLEALFAYINPEREPYPLAEVRIDDVELTPERLEDIAAEISHVIEGIDSLAKHMTTLKEASPTLLSVTNISMLQEKSNALKAILAKIEDSAQDGFPQEIEGLTLEDIGLASLHDLGTIGEEIMDEVTRLYRYDRSNGLSDSGKAAKDLQNTLFRELNPRQISLLAYFHLVVVIGD